MNTFTTSNLKPQTSNLKPQMKNKLRIVFMGTPDFAVPSLEILVENGYNVVAVVTAPDRPAGRGQEIRLSDVKQCALKHNIPILQPEKLKDEQFLAELKSYNANLQIVVAFRMLPEAVWSMPELGTFNLHASLLPQYRGAAPINWAILNGETETGVTTFFLKHEIDTGDIILQEKEPIRADDNVGSLYSRLMVKGAQLVLATVKQIENGTVSTQAQVVHNTIKEAPKIFKDTCKIDWNKPATQIHNHIRGLSPYPAAWTELNGKTLKIFKSEVGSKQSEGKPGSTVSDNKTFLSFNTTDTQLGILELQLEGKKRMSTEEFLRGHSLL